MAFLDDETKSLFTLGWIKPIDFAVVVFEVLTFLGILIFWLAFRFETIYVVLAFLLLLFVHITWAISIIYRVGYFVLKLWAIIEVMPERAAQVAVAYIQNPQAPPGGVTKKK